MYTRKLQESIFTMITFNITELRTFPSIGRESMTGLRYNFSLEQCSVPFKLKYKSLSLLCLTLGGQQVKTEAE